MPYCPKCGSPLEGDEKYCPNCGILLEEISSENPLQKPKKFRKIFLISSIILIFLSLLLFFLYIQGYIFDKSLPSIKILSPQSKEYIVDNAGKRIVEEIKIHVDDNKSIKKVELFVNNVPMKRFFSKGTFTYTWTIDLPGTYTLRAEAYDLAGNKGVSNTITINVKLELRTSISGKVVSITGEPIQGVNIFIKDKNISAISNDNGEYTIEKAPKGDVILIAELPGEYEKVEKKVKIIEGKVNYVDFILKPVSLSGILEGYVYAPVSSVEELNISYKDIPFGYIPLEDALVEVENISSTRTDKRGYFKISNLPSGYHSVKISHPSYKTFVSTVEIQPNRTSRLSGEGYISLPPISAKKLDIIVNNINLDEYPKVKIYFQVIDAKTNKAVLGLKKENFEFSINNNNPSFNISQISISKDIPSSIVLVLDRSGSMQGRAISDLINSALLFIKEYFQPNSGGNIEVISFGGNISIDVPFTNDKDFLLENIQKLSADGGTPLYDAIWRGIDDLNEVNTKRKILIVMTDGGENSSSSEHGGGGGFPENDSSLLINYAKSSKIPIYAIGLEGEGFSVDADKDLDKIAKSTGGQYLKAPDSKALKDLYTNFLTQIQNQYLLTFIDNYPKDSNKNVILKLKAFGFEGINSFSY